MPKNRRDDAAAAVRFLYELQGSGVKLGLRNIKALLGDLGDPHLSLPAVHIAGSNGKGSSAALLASVLMEAGYRTALYTSPHLLDYRERIRVHGRKIPPAFLASWVRTHKPKIIARKITFFEATTALAFDWFRSQKVDIAIIETGLGGRLDATNVLMPLCTLISSISLEHVHLLGGSEKAIAFEKAGITREQVPCVLGDMRSDVIRYLSAMLGKKRVPVLLPDRSSVRLVSDRPGRTIVDIRSSGRMIRGVTCGFEGRHQLPNIQAVMRTLEVLRDSYGLDISDTSIRQGIRKVVQNTRLEGRCSPVRGLRDVFVDVAHNPAAMQKTVGYFMKRFGRKSMRLVFGTSADKDVDSMITSLKPLVFDCIAVKARTQRGLDVSVLTALWQEQRIPVRLATSVSSGVRIALKGKPRGPVLVTGSHFVAGEALASIRRIKYLTISQ